MKKFALTAIASTALTAGAIGLATPALADNNGTVALPGPVAVYPRDSVLGGANPYLPYGTNPSVPYGTWSQN